MNPDLYGAWLTAGNNLQPVGGWLAEWWPFLAIAAVAAAVIGWAWWPTRSDDFRTCNDRRQAAWFVIRDERPEPAAPGQDQQLLNHCNAILAATNARKED